MALRERLSYGWVVVGVVFVALLVSAGRAYRAGQSLETELGWSLATTSFAVSIGLLLYGLSGPVSGWLMDRFGPKHLTLAGLASAPERSRARR
jgi:MFS family permease